MTRELSIKYKHNEEDVLQLLIVKDIRVEEEMFLVRTSNSRPTPDISVTA